jgi:DnaJ-like protein
MYNNGSNKPIKRRFEASQETTVKDLQRILTKIGATSLRIQTEKDYLDPHEAGSVKVVFDRAGKRYVRECSEWTHPTDNLRAIGLQIDYLYRALELYGVESTSFDIEFDNIFAGFIPPPDDSALLLGDGRAPWWEVLKIKPDAKKEEIRSAYRALARVYAPDLGGDEESMKTLNIAYKKAIDGIKK